MSFDDKDSSAPMSALEDDTLQYRSIAPAAVIALLLGMASIAALASPLLLAVPVMACLIAVAALISIARSDGRLTGAALARWGMALAIVMGVCAAVRPPVRHALLDRQATAAVERWTELLRRGQWEASFECLTPRGRSKLHPPTRDPGMEPPSAFEVRTHMFEEIKTDPLVEQLKSMSGELLVTLEERLALPTQRGRRTTVQNLYAIRPATGSSDSDPVRVSIAAVHNPTDEGDGMPMRIEDWAVE